MQDCSLAEKLLIPSSLLISAVVLEAAHKSCVNLGSDTVRPVETSPRPKPGLCLDWRIRRTGLVLLEPAMAAAAPPLSMRTAGMFEMLRFEVAEPSTDTAAVAPPLPMDTAGMF